MTNAYFKITPCTGKYRNLLTIRLETNLSEMERVLEILYAPQSNVSKSLM